MIRVVIDTNVIVSAMLRSGGLPETVLNLALGGEILSFISGPVFAEYEEVLRRPRFAIDPGKLSTALSSIRASAFFVDPEARVTAALDPDDNIFLECAEAAGADFLVTGNIRDFPAAWGKTQIVTPRQFLEVAGMQPIVSFKPRLS